MTKMMWAAAAAGLFCGVLANEAKAQAVHGLELSFDVSRYRYEEHFEGGSVRDAGSFYGAGVEYGRTLGRWSLAGRFHLDAGRMGFRASDGTTLDDVGQTQGQLEFLAGRTFVARSGFEIAGYTGVGARVLIDRSGGHAAPSGELGYDREVSYAYLPLGLSAQVKRPNQEPVLLYAQYNWLLGGEVESHLDDAEPGLPNVTLNLQKGHGWEIGAKVARRLARGSVGLQPYLRIWRIAPSDSLTVEEEDFELELFEPRSTTRELGVRLFYRF